MGEISRALKVFFMPHMAQGHMIPLCQFARLFAARDHHHHPLRFPSDEVGLPVGIENFFNVTDAATAWRLNQAVGLLRNQLEPFIEQNPPDCIVSDFMYPWTAAIATRLGIPRIVFNTFCLFVVCMINACKGQLQSKPELLSHEHDDDSSCPFVVSGLPDPITLTNRPPKWVFEMLETLIETDQKNSYGLTVNNFNDLDGQDYIDYYKKSTDLKVWHIGPASLMLRNILPKEDLHPQTKKGHEHIRTWLDSKESNSVVYVSFGMHRESKQNNKCGEEEEKKTWLPKGFEERLKKENRGLILMKWAPQELILNHPATGGFLTHCGWTSVTEAVSAGVPMMTWPVFIEQPCNEKLITQVHGFGVEVGAEEWKPSPYERMEKLVSRVKIEKAVRRLKAGGDEAERVREKAREMREKTRKAVGEDGSSQRNLTALIEDLKLIAMNRAASKRQTRIY
ncbi:UDP-glucose flavonoid 3-O-glucosyltransferase 7-like [Neltuma alba]|uniref:UDP-glucose flavonoid 3-O-glucosyltransferase 7-like n=1 Tax=Neltuma alba TaxID=207710 RepID=UPI0010A4C9AD|nr:UDP-glucose flavonoid 3-O-glucosyltransferase 7-like [Prosopis alba]